MPRRCRRPITRDAGPSLIRIETRAGHGAGKPTAKVIEEAADKLAFAIHFTGTGTD
jgi:prolyl oligopeptidase